MTLQGRLAELRAAASFLTVLPLGEGPEMAPLSRSLWAFPLVGAAVGTVAGIVLGVATSSGVGPSLAATLAFAAVVGLTGALHLDGLADCADGLGGQTPERKLEIMRDSRTGAFGVLALILATLLWVGAVSEIADRASILHFAFAAAIGRGAMVLLLAIMPPARTEGLGAMAEPHGSGGMLALVATAFLTLLLGWPGFAAVVLGLLATLAVRQLAMTRIGGQTGDVLGAGGLLAETAALLGFAVALST